MTKLRVSTCAFVVAVSLAGCTRTSEVEYAGEVRVTSPQLVQLRPGLKVVADADEPLFYSQGNYWLYRDGYWFRSPSYVTGFARVEYEVVPVEIRVIDQPELYVQYRRHVEQIRQAQAGTRTRSRSALQTTPQPTYQPPVQQQQPKPATPKSYPAEPTYPDQQHPEGTQPSDVNPTQPTSPAIPTQPVIPPEPGSSAMPPDRKVPPDTGAEASGTGTR